MVFAYWEKEVTNEQFTTLKAIISEFKTICDSERIIPILIYIPTATQVYAGLYSTDSNNQFIDKVKNIPGNPSLEALVMIANQLDVDLINLLPGKRSRGKLIENQ